jgi:PAS domain S-box-containing protein
VTERKRADRKLRESADRLRLALEAAHMGDWSWDGATDLVTLSDRAAEIFGIPPDQPMTWAGMRDLLTAEDAERARIAAETALARRGQFNFEYRIRRLSDGTWAWVAARGRGIYDADGRARGMIGVVQDFSDRKQAEERQDLLIRELHHRVKNTLATVQAIFGSTARAAVSLDHFYQAFVGRIVSLANTHSLLTEDDWQTASMRQLLETELHPYDDGGRIALAGPIIDLPSDLAVPVGMAIHELTTNAAKHGALSVSDGCLDVAWTVDPEPPGRVLRFTWTERNGPPVPPPSREGFGSRLLHRVLRTQLQADVGVDYDPSGFRLRMEVPLPDRDAGQPFSSLNLAGAMRSSSER